MDSSARDEYGNAQELIKAGLLRAGAPRAMPTPPPSGGSQYFGKPLTEAQEYIRKGLAAAGPPKMAEPSSNTDERAKQIGKHLMNASAERIARSMPYEAPAEKQRSAQEMIREGLRQAYAEELAKTAKPTTGG
jgi:hypothetical protein